MSQQIQDKLDALAGAITDELSDAEKQRLDAVKAASDAAVETNRLRDDLSAQQAALAASVAEVTKLRKQLEAGGSGIPLWKNGAKLSDSRAWILPDGLNDNLIVDAPVELYCGVDMWPKNPGRPVLTLRADDWTLRGVPNRLTFNAPVGMPIKDGRYNFAECIRVGDNAGLTGKPVRNGRVIDISGGRVDALAKCYPDADGILFDRPASTADLLADGIYIGGAKNILIRMPDLTARYENTIRATSDHGVMPSGIAVVGGSVRNIGNKAALNPRHVNGFVAFGVRLFATGENSAVGVGNGDSANPGNPIGVSIIGCTVEGGGLTLHQAHGVELLRNQFRWPGTRANSAIGVTANSADNVTITDNGGESPTQQKAMVGYVGDRSKIRDLVEARNAWTVKP
jgi:hypothetical protein